MTETPRPTGSPSDPHSRGGRRPTWLPWAVGAGIAVLVAVGIVLVANDDDDGSAGDADPGGSVPSETVPGTADAPFTSESETDADPDADPDSSPDSGADSGGPAVCGDPDVVETTDVDALLTILGDDGLADCAAPPDETFAVCPIESQCLDIDPVFVVGGTHGVERDAPFTDARTGETSASTARRILVGAATTGADSPLWGDWFVASTCDAVQQTGLVTLEPGVIATSEQPVPLDASCTADPIERVDGQFEGYRTVVAGDGAFVVDEAPADPGPAPTDDFAQFADDAPDGGLTADAALIQQIHARGAAEPDCQWFLAPDDVGQFVQVLGECGAAGNFWVYAAGLSAAEAQLATPDTVAATTATHVDPVDASLVPATDTTLFQTLYDAAFPCGWGHLAYTACAADESDIEATGLVTVAAVFLDDVPVAGDGAERAHLVDFGATGGPTFTLEQDAAGWSVGSSDGTTRARAMFRGNSVTLAVPADELPGRDMTYQWSTAVGGSTVPQPPIPVVGQLIPIAE